MTTLDRMKMLALAAKDLEEAVQVYEKAKADKGSPVYVWDVPRHCTREAIKRRITQIRQDLLALEREL